ncbi:MAG: hypothetical protein MHMPM18_001763 [Marteilia pararefringens]
MTNYTEAIVEDLRNILVEASGSGTHCETLEEFGLIWRRRGMRYLGEGLVCRHRYRLFIVLCMKITIYLLMVNPDLIWVVNSIFLLYALYNSQAILPHLPIQVDEFHYAALLDKLNMLTSAAICHDFTVTHDPSHALMCLIEMFERKCFMLTLTMIDTSIPQDIQASEGDNQLQLTKRDLEANFNYATDLTLKLPLDRLLDASRCYHELKQPFIERRSALRGLIDLYSDEALQQIRNLKYAQDSGNTVD